MKVIEMVFRNTREQHWTLLLLFSLSVTFLFGLSLFFAYKYYGSFGVIILVGLMLAAGNYAE